MRRGFPRLQETDTLSNAIEGFCRLGVSELPVVDADGDLVGMVTQDELVHICLSDRLAGAACVTGPIMLSTCGCNDQLR